MGFKDMSRATDRLDFAFNYRGIEVHIDLKEKKQSYSSGIRRLWPEVAPENLFILDETVYRRIVWQGGGGYLAVRDDPEDRWVIFGPWELTLGPRKRYERWGERATRFKKGKVLLDLSSAALESRFFDVGDLLSVVDRALRDRDAIAAVATQGQEMPEIGRPP